MHFQQPFSPVKYTKDFKSVHNHDLHLKQMELAQKLSLLFKFFIDFHHIGISCNFYIFFAVVVSTCMHVYHLLQCWVRI
jgi:hypothetical protein